MINALRDFLKLESAGGILLFIAALLAMLLANSPLAGFYGLLIEMPVEVRVGPLELGKPLLLWINDGLMAIFFFLVGLELKREILDGELADPANVVLPALGALGGMLVPALFYLLINWGDPVAMNGWAIPAATDIAFALGILLLLGERVPKGLKVFLVSLAIFDDMGAIVIIAMFYTSELSALALGVALACLTVLFLLNRRGVVEHSPYLLIGLVLWVAVLKSGVHATLAGVLLALFIPYRDREHPTFSPLRVLEHDLHKSVALVVLPLFAFVNSGIDLRGVGLDYLLHPVPLGIALGLFVGKQLGVFLFCALGVRFGLARLPEGVGWLTLYGTALLCGIGFTMSLFIGALSFEETGVNLLFDDRLGIILGSLMSALAGYLVLRRSLPYSGDSEQRQKE
ncbi:MAG: Na+/H+ antiporter NhaA [Candidatus Sedimenticola endophacoides]|nr:MAG: Na+/H+ antiporter NhaA [Candidatus Sedimenticola endophacoides]PUE00771.1 MAG: Na+/H+ antiporter NhaA [Candidatus Sedimenticola endophacoides]PUE04215.1 MAG: Na+/H+ antiporter NhaA [Candidatus Sedimenticola endophacoides]